MGESVEGWQITAQHISGKKLEVWNDGENAIVGTIQDLMPRLHSGEFTEISLVRAEQPVWT